MIDIGSGTNKLVVKEMWGFFSKDEKGNEGLCGVHGPMGWMPLVAADKDRVDSLRDVAKQLHEGTGQKIVLKKFSNVETLEVMGE